jgi:hypothetical protein
MDAWQDVVLSAIFKLPVKPRRRALFLSFNRYVPSFSRPMSFNEKVNWRILSDRRPLLEWTCDKLAMKEHAAATSGIHIPRTLWAGTDLAELCSLEMPEHWILKPNHRTGLVYFGHGRPDAEELVAQTTSWWRPVEAEQLGEWAYSRARPMLLAEELIGTPGSSPTDYKFFVFQGQVALIQVDVGRHTAHQRRLYLPDWSPLDIRYGAHPIASAEPCPDTLDLMLKAASELGSEFDFIRIDLYSIGARIYFGEFTPYPCSGLDRFTPRSFDRGLGARWQIPRPGGQDLSSGVRLWARGASAQDAEADERRVGGVEPGCT